MGSRSLVPAPGEEHDSFSRLGGLDTAGGGDGKSSGQGEEQLFQCCVELLCGGCWGEPWLT